MSLVDSLRGIEPANNYRFTVTAKGLDPLYVYGGSFPNFQIDAFEKILDFKKVKVPESVELPDLELEIYENNTNIGYRFFQEWMRSAVNGDGTFRLPSSYRRDLTISRNTQQGEGGVPDVAFRMLYKKAWPKSITPYSPNSDSRSEILQYTVSLSVDDVDIEFLDKKEREGEFPDGSLNKTSTLINTILGSRLFDPGRGVREQLRF